ncbi:MAG: ABC transporter ATP-binding protein [Lachnospiraceae bacterium]
MNALEIRNLTKQYDSFTLDHLNLTLPSGCIMGLIGENGAGKSTTIKLILDMIQRDDGSITILGKDNRDNLSLTKEDLGVVLDEAGFPACLNAGQIGKIMSCTFQNWDMEVYKKHLKRLALPDSKKFKEFSKGMKMKLAIAVAMSHDAKLLILDEPTSGLDPVIRDEVIDLFADFTRDENHSILISSHIVSDLEKICDYIAFLHQGKLLLCEEKDVLLENYAIIHCSTEQLQELNTAAIIGKKVSSYGAEAVIRRDSIPSGMDFTPVSIEELFISMVKEVR